MSIRSYDSDRLPWPTSVLLVAAIAIAFRLLGFCAAGVLL